jgi:hypothetical protein
MWVVLTSPTFDLVDQAPRCKKIPATEQRENSFLYTILLSENRSIYDEFHNNRHACSQ